MKTLVTVIFSALMASCCFFTDPEISISQPWVRAAPPNVPMAGYMQLHNNTDSTLTLVGAHSDMFSSIEFHRSVEKDGVYRMIRKSTLEVPAHDSLELKPGDYHLMLFNPKQTLQAGETVDITLQFSNKQEKVISFDVRKQN